MGLVIPFAPKNVRNQPIGDLPEWRKPLSPIASFDPIGHDHQLAADLDVLLCQSAQVLSQSYQLLLRAMCIQASLVHSHYLHTVQSGEELLECRGRKHPEGGTLQ